MSAPKTAQTMSQSAFKSSTTSPSSLTLTAPKNLASSNTNQLSQSRTQVIPTSSTFSVVKQTITSMAPPTKLNSNNYQSSILRTESQRQTQDNTLRSSSVTSLGSTKVASSTNKIQSAPKYTAPAITSGSKLLSVSNQRYNTQNTISRSGTGYQQNTINLSTQKSAVINIPLTQNSINRQTSTKSLPKIKKTQKTKALRAKRLNSRRAAKSRSLIKTRAQSSSLSINRPL
jgi:hypothetical protein